LREYSRMRRNCFDLFSNIAEQRKTAHWIEKTCQLQYDVCKQQ
jgi:hypothetical protein